MSATVQLNTRIDPEIKKRGDAVFSRAGLSSSEVVRSVWSYAATNQVVPDFLIQQSPVDSESLVTKIRAGAGIVQQEAATQGLFLNPNGIDLESLKDDMYEEMADEVHGQLAPS